MAYNLPKVSTNYTTGKRIHFSPLRHGNVQNVPENRISGQFNQFSNPLTHSKALFITSEEHLRSHVHNPQITGDEAINHTFIQTNGFFS